MAQTSQKPECTICCEPFNRSSRKQISCGCEFTACRECTERYLLESATDPDCMSCHRRWPLSVLYEKLPKVFVNGALQTHRQDVLFDREKSMLPAMQPYATMFSSSIGERKLSALRRGEQSPTNMSYRAYYGHIMADILSLPLDTSDHPYQYIRACPENDCRGFLTKEWECGMCQKHVCSECNEVKVGGKDDAAHLCDPAMVATARLIARDSRPCPKCSSLIYKISGCDHMFCTACKTPFSWVSGRIMQRNSNPLFYEWQRAQAEPRDNTSDAESPDQVAPGGLPAWLQMNAWRYTKHVLDLCGDIGFGNVPNIGNMPARLSHNAHLLSDVIFRVRDVATTHAGLRVYFLIGAFTEEDFKKELQKAERENDKKRDLREVYDMFQAASHDIGVGAWHAKSPERLVELIEEWEKLREYTNRSLGEVGRIYSCKPKLIGANFCIGK